MRTTPRHLWLRRSGNPYRRVVRRSMRWAERLRMLPAETCWSGAHWSNTAPVTVIRISSVPPLRTKSRDGQIVHDWLGATTLLCDGRRRKRRHQYHCLRNAPNNCDIIIDDIFISMSRFQDGIVAQAVNTVTAAGALYFLRQVTKGASRRIQPVTLKATSTMPAHPPLPSRAEQRAGLFTTSAPLERRSAGT